MGRSKSNTKRRPKGKRGWRKIDANSLINPPEETSLKEQQHRISELRDSQLWKQDIKPRKTNKLTKSQKKLKAKRKLLSRGFIINSTDSNNALNKETISYKHKQRLNSFKQTQKFIKNNENMAIKQSKQTAIIKFKNKTTKKVKLNNHKNIISNKKHIKNSIDFHQNNKYNLYKIKHSKTNTKNASIKDLWNDSNKRNNNNNNDDSSYSDDVLPDVNPLKIIEKQRKASKCEIKSNRSTQNNFVPKWSLLSLPNPGESINPMIHHYYYLKWKSFQLKSKQMFKRQYQRKSTQKWYKETVGIEIGIENKIKELRKKSNKMKRLYLAHYRQYNAKKGWIANDNNCKRMDGMRQISWKQKMCDIKSNRRNYNTRLHSMRNRMKLSKKNGGHIYGSKYRFKRRRTPIMASDKVNNCLMNTLHSGTDHPLSFMFNEMQKQNRIHGDKRHRFVLPKKKAFLGPRFKVQTRIGKLHHANVHNKYFSGIDDL